MSFQCQECHQSFPYKRNLTRHIKTVHGNKPRKDNEARKEGLLAGLYSETFEAQVESVSHAWKDVTDKARKQGLLAWGSCAACEESVESVSHAWKDVTDKARKQGLLACGSWDACEESVESVPQAVFKSPAEYVMMAMKGSFTKNKSLLRHVRTVHQGKKRTDNEKQGQKAGAPRMRQLGRM